MNIKIVVIATFILISHSAFAEEKTSDCSIDLDSYAQILEQVENKNPNAINSLPECFLSDRKLILKASLIDPQQFQYAAKNLKEDEAFVRRLLKTNPQILQFASPNLLIDPDFMERATYLNRDALQYASPSLLDNRVFMKKMITIDSKNYAFASDRLKSIPEFAKMAFADNGMLLKSAPQKIKSDKTLVEIAIKSNNSAIEFASDDLKKDKYLQQISDVKTSIKSKEELADFLRKNYFSKKEKKNLGLVISNQAKFAKGSQIISRNYVTKWQKYLDYSDAKVGENMRLISADSRNYPISWKDDFRRSRDLVTKIENFFLRHNVDQNTIDNLSVTYLWKVKQKPLTIAFNLYLLRDSKDADLGDGFSDITSLTAIAQKQDNKWKLSVVEVIFDSETKVDVSYRNGHKKYVLWDLYKVNPEDKNPKILFRVDDHFNEYFEIFEEQSGGKYQMLYRFDSLF